MKRECPYCHSMTAGLQGRSHNVCGHCRRYMDENEATNAILTAPKKAKPVLEDVLEIPPRPFEVKHPRPALSRGKGKMKRAVVMGDTHIRFHDDSALAIAEGIIKDVQPFAIVHVGDLLDAGTISTKFPTDPARMDTLQGDIDIAREKLAQWAALAPKAQRWLCEGNHEQRLTRLIWGFEGPNREVARLRMFQKYLSWPSLLDLDNIGWNWVDYNEQPHPNILPRLLVKHGDVVRKQGGASARGEWEKYGKSGLSGHTHRANVWRHKDYNGQATWIETGCTCLYSAPGAKHPDWQQAVTIIEWSDDETLMHVEQVVIREGRAIWDGKEFAA